jgi:hypothetical protein
VNQDPTYVPMARAPAPAPSKRPLRLVAIVSGALVLGISAGLLVQWALKWHAQPAAAMPVLVQAPAAWTPVVATPAAPQQPVVQGRVPVTASMKIEGHPAAVHGDVALPSGARFEFSLRAPQAGHIDVLAMAPGASQHTVLWSGYLPQGGAATTPMLRLQGQRGIEKLRVVLRSASGEILGVRDIRIWHS